MKHYFKRILFVFISIQLALLGMSNMSAQTVAVSGVVKDAVTNEPLIGATVMVKGTTNGVSTDVNGNYSIKAKAEDILVCQIIGYKNQETKVGTRSVINFVLSEDNEMLDATVVVGYGTLKKTQLVGSVENLDGEAIVDRPNANVTRSLQGQVAGLNIRQLTQVVFIFVVTEPLTIRVRTSAAVLQALLTVSEARVRHLSSSMVWKVAFLRLTLRTSRL